MIAAINELKFWLFDFVSKARLRSQLEILNRDLNAPAEQGYLLGEEIAQAQLTYLRKLLCVSPLWFKGHLKLAQLSLKLNDLATAYASAKAVLHLEKDLRSRVRLQASLMLASCFLKRGLNTDALECLEPLLKIHPNNVALKEELAAVYLALGDHAQVVSLLTAIPKDKLSHASAAALDHSRYKLN